MLRFDTVLSSLYQELLCFCNYWLSHCCAAVQVSAVEVVLAFVFLKTCYGLNT